MNLNQKTSLIVCLCLFLATIFFAPWEVQTIQRGGGKEFSSYERSFNPIFYPPPARPVAQPTVLSTVPGQARLMFPVLICEWLALALIGGSLHFLFAAPRLSLSVPTHRHESVATN